MNFNKKTLSDHQLFNLLGEKFDHRLLKTTPLNDLPKDLKEYLEPLYNSTEEKVRRNFCASIINAMFTEQLTEFFMSENLIERLISNDLNLKRSTVDHKAYSELYAFLSSKQIIEVVEKPGRIMIGQKAKAGKWKWIEKNTLKLLSQYWNEDGLSDGF